MSEVNKIHRFKRLSVYDEWPECFICREKVDKGFSLSTHDEPDGLVIIDVCDNCLAKAKSSPIGFCIEEE